MNRVYYCIIIVIFNIYGLFAQTQFDKGFADGFKNGYCQDQGVGCIAPIAPIAPIPTVYENSNSYKDGYNRGFQVGLQKQQKDSPNQSVDRKRYQTASPKFVDNFIYKPDYKLMMLALEAKQRQHEQWAISEPERKENFQKQLEIADKHFKKMDYNNAVNYAKSALSNGFHNHYAYYIIGVSKYALEDYDDAIYYLKKADEMGNPMAQKYLDTLKEKEKNMDYVKPIQFGIKGGYAKSDLTSSFVGGIFLQGNRNIFGIKNFSGAAELLFLKQEYELDDASITLVNPDMEDVIKDNFLQVNLILKNRIIKRLDLVYGVGMSAGLDKQNMFFDVNGGLQGYITHKIFLEARFNKSVSKITYSEEAINNPPLNIMLMLGYKF